MQFLGSTEFKENLPQYANLFNASFQKNIDLDLLKWRYLKNPSDDLLACVEFEHDDLIANYSASPCLLDMQGTLIKTALSMTTMTHPAHAGKGLFTTLAKGLYDNMTERGYEIIWGFPNKNSHFGFVNRLNWFDIYEIPTMTLNLNAKKVGELTISLDSHFLADYNHFQKQSQYIKVAKTPEYLRWRYALHPTNKYENLVIKQDNLVKAFAVVKIFHDALDIIDFQVTEKDTAKELMETVLCFATQQKLQKLNCWAPRHHFLHSLCEKFQFENREPISYFGACVLRQGKVEISTLKDYSNWYIQMGDSDVF